MSPTIRQTIAILLEQKHSSAIELAQALCLTPKEVQEHLEHLSGSLKNRFLVEPACCRDCGFVFKKRDRLDPPGRCPRCRSQRVEGPWFGLK